MSIITLTTDFGDRDHFVAAMKGAILSIAPRATIIDVTHQVPAFDTAEAAFTVAQASRSFPNKSVHMVVVDPGVGSARRPILVECGGQFFVGPDNGVLGMIYARGKARVRHITESKLFRHPVSATFHGRDIFAPVAAHVALGVKPAAIGPVIDDYLRTASDQPVRTGKKTWAGAVLKVDRFGNLITNLHVDDFPALTARPVSLLAGVRCVERVVSCYADAPAGEPVLIVGSAGYVEVVVNQGSAARVLGCGAGSPMELTVY